MPSRIETRLARLGLPLPATVSPRANYVPTARGQLGLHCRTTPAE